MSRILDLTLPISHGMATFPAHWHSPVEVKILGRHDREGRSTRELRLGTHTGTHIDAPLHFIKGGRSIDQVPIQATVGRAVLLDVTFKQPGEAITEAELNERGHQVARGGIVLLRTGWSRYWGQPQYYREHPYLTEGSASWLLERGIRALGLDLPDVEDPRGGAAHGVPGPRHLQLLHGGIILIENLTNVSGLEEGTLFLIALPLLVMGGDAAPARVIAIQDRLIE